MLFFCLRGRGGANRQPTINLNLKAPLTRSVCPVELLGIHRNLSLPLISSTHLRACNRNQTLTIMPNTNTKNKETKCLHLGGSCIQGLEIIRGYHLLVRHGLLPDSSPPHFPPPQYLLLASSVDTWSGAPQRTLSSLSGFLPPSRIRTHYHLPGLQYLKLRCSRPTTAAIFRSFSCWKRLSLSSASNSSTCVHLKFIGQAKYT